MEEKEENKEQKNIGKKKKKEKKTQREKGRKQRDNFFKKSSCWFKLEVVNCYFSHIGSKGCALSGGEREEEGRNCHVLTEICRFEFVFEKKKLP